MDEDGDGGTKEDTHTHRATTMQNAQSSTPEFIRLPAQRCPFTGLSRSTLNNLILPTVHNRNQPPVRSHVLRQPGRSRGIRLIDFSSLIAFIRGQSGQPQNR